MTKRVRFEIGSNGAFRSERDDKDDNRESRDEHDANRFAHCGWGEWG